MRLLVCGGRDYQDWEAFNNAMGALPVKPTIVIQGGARGADWMSKRWAKNNQIHCAEVPALWRVFGAGAGLRRNAAMLLLLPEYCLALPGGRGTADMVARARAAGVPVWQPYG